MKVHCVYDVQRIRDHEFGVVTVTADGKETSGSYEDPPTSFSLDKDELGIFEEKCCPTCGAVKENDLSYDDFFNTVCEIAWGGYKSKTRSNVNPENCYEFDVDLEELIALTRNHGKNEG
jgi:hypothetical protein